MLTKKLSNVGKKESIPMQNTHDLLVGTLSIGIPSNIVHKNLLPRIKLDLSENHWVI